MTANGYGTTLNWWKDDARNRHRAGCRTWNICSTNWYIYHRKGGKN